MNGTTRVHTIYQVFGKSQETWSGDLFARLQTASSWAWLGMPLNRTSSGFKEGGREGAREEPARAGSLLQLGLNIEHIWWDLGIALNRSATHKALRQKSTKSNRT